MKFPLTVLLVLFSFLHHVSGQPAEPRNTRSEYIGKYKELAVQEMLMYGIPASITMAQAILESGDGNSPLARYANNHFGIKCHSSWKGPSFIQDDDEKNECFRKYRSVSESFRDHSEFLRGRKWYAPLFELKPTDYKGWAKGLKAAGYATHPKYAEMLIALIEQHNLNELDRVGGPKSRDLESDLKEPELVIAETRIINLKNNIRFIVAKPGDDANKIARDNDMRTWQIYKYNDLGNRDMIKPGDVIYLQPKRSKGDQEFHVVKKGESMYQIAQQHGIKLKQLYRKNRMTWGEQPDAGRKLYLRNSAPE